MPIDSNIQSRKNNRSNRKKPQLENENPQENNNESLTGGLHVAGSQCDSSKDFDDSDLDDGYEGYDTMDEE